MFQVFFMRPGSAMIEIAYPSQGWYFYYATQGYATANYPSIRVFQLEVFTIAEVTVGRTVYDHDVWVPTDKLLEFVNNAVSGKPSYYPYKLGQEYKAVTQKDNKDRKQGLLLHGLYVHGLLGN